VIDQVVDSTLRISVIATASGTEKVTARTFGLMRFIWLIPPEPGGWVNFPLSTI
jgi:hypothetical protein